MKQDSVGLQQERVQIILETLIKGQNKIPEFQQALDRMRLAVTDAGVAFSTASGRMLRATDVTQKFTQQYDSFSGIMRASLPEWRALNDSGIRLNSWGGRFGMTLRRLTHGAKGFRMEMLGVMFFGQMLKQTMLGLLQPAMEAFGVFELLQVMLTVLFLPIMELLFPLFLKFTEFFMNLPEPVKLAVGGLTVFLAVVGTILSVLGTFALGIGSLILTTGLLTGKITTLVGAATALKGAFATAFLIGAWVSGILAFVAVLFMLENKFGSFGNALKAWASGIALAIAIVVESVANGIIATLAAPMKFLQKMINAAANAVSMIPGFGGTAKFLRTAANAIGNVASQRLDIVGPTADLLDRAGFNPRPVGAQGSQQNNINFSPTYNMSGASKPEIILLVEEVNRRMLDEIRRTTGVRGA